MKIHGKIFFLIICFFFFEKISNSQICGIWYASTSAQLTNAITNACGAGGGIVKISSGTFVTSTHFSLCNNIIIEGGYNAGFTSKSSAPGTTIIQRNQSNPTANPVGTGNYIIAFYCSGISNFRLQDLRITVNNAATDSKITNYGIYLNSCSSYNIVRCQVFAGKGSDGSDGSNGTNGSNGGDAPQPCTGGGPDNGGEDNCGSRAAGNGGGGAYNGANGGGGSGECNCSGSGGGTGGGPGGGSGGGGEMAAAAMDARPEIPAIIVRELPYAETGPVICRVIPVVQGLMVRMVQTVPMVVVRLIPLVFLFRVPMVPTAQMVHMAVAVVEVGGAVARGAHFVTMVAAMVAVAVAVEGI